MSLFQKSVTNKYLKNLDNEKVSKAFENFQRFYGDKLRLHNIMQLKEENYQEGFLREIFVETLGYTINPDNDFNLTTEFKNLNDARKADGAILRDGKAIGVIELKSTKTKHLESIKEQAFSYKNNQPGCRYIITSNFQSLRFYIDDATEYEEFNLFNLNEKDFKLLYLLLSKESIFSDLPEKLKQETKFHENDISSQLYTDYKRFKNKIFENLVKNNPQYDKLLLFKKSQKLLDRFLFVFFAEDSGLMPPNAVSKIIEQWKQLKELDEYRPLYTRFQKLFAHLDKGHKYEKWGEIPAYNGGLFRNDELLDSTELKIDDEVLEKDSLILSAYDFNTEVDVNILGHIFEHSLNEIENITAQLQGEEIDKKKTKRKKDGIFYTPKYITKYIVENTVGTLCKEKKEELKINNLFIDETYRKTDGKLKEKGKKLYKTFDNYKKWLLTLKILDPACGSGAFLNATLDFLITEHKQTDNLIAELTGDALGLFDTDKAILENNIYGVDINEESVEIAKLSMWLRTAQKGRPLSDLSGNIKCGNSLIDDPEVSGDKAFDWNVEFKGIMDAGGFDIVIGNPPYVQSHSIKELEKEYYYKHFYTTEYQLNTYGLFVEKVISILKHKCLYGLIIPNYFLSTKFDKKLREYIFRTYHAIEVVNVFKVFEGTTVDTLILTGKKDTNTDSSTYIRSISKSLNTIHDRLTSLSLRNWEFEEKKTFNSEINDIQINFSKDIVLEGDTILKDYLNMYKGMQPYEKGKGSPRQTREMMQAKIYHSKKKIDESYLPLLGAKHIKRYYFLNNDEFIKYGKNLAAPRSPKLFQGERILINRILYKSNINGVVIYEPYINNTDVFNLIPKEGNKISLKVLFAIIVSKLCASYFKLKNINLNRATYPKINVNTLESFPIPKIANIEQEKFETNVDNLLILNKNLQKRIAKFIKRIKSNLEVEKLSGKLQNFYNFDFKTFITELKKQKIKLSLTQQDEWEDYFDTYKKEINKLQTQISQTDKEIDKMVYELYELTEEEIGIVEESLK